MHADFLAQVRYDSSLWANSIAGRESEIAERLRLGPSITWKSVDVTGRNKSLLHNALCDLWAWADYTLKCSAISPDFRFKASAASFATVPRLYVFQVFVA